MDQTASSAKPHVLILPFCAQGHIKPMFKLGQLLCHAGLRISFVNSEHNHQNLLRQIDLLAFQAQYPEFSFLSIPDGLAVDHPRSGLTSGDLFLPPARSVMTQHLNELITGFIGRNTKPACIIADGVMCFAIHVAREFEIPSITFRTYSATCTWAYFHFKTLTQEGLVPLPEGVDMDNPVTCIQGLENLLRNRDLPIMCRYKVAARAVEFFIEETSIMAQASALLLNTFDELEAPLISKLRSIFNKIYTIGPIHSLYKSYIKSNLPQSNGLSNTSGSLVQEERSCMTWLESKPPKSVLYVSFGSVVELKQNQLLEFWHGLVNSEKFFLWVIRSDLISGEKDAGQNVPAELKEGTMDRGCIVSWAPQEEVLAHPAVGGFMTHSGWNSTLEGIAAGVPMICWPLISDQQVNSRCVSDIWKTGLDMKDKCDKVIIEQMVRDLMENKKDEIRISAEEKGRLAQESVEKGGSSYNNFEKLIEDIRSMALARAHESS
uniref:Glycosyltransferase n=1 Tax=Polygala tenuifolia TaxID=355332 RepID=A0A3G3NBX9_9FABA|nr:UDP-glucosyltransferase UGT709P1 [Polygala tenuifolia]